MYLDVVLIDVLHPDGTLSTYWITPQNDRDKVVVDRIGDIHREKFGETDADIAGLRIYGASRHKFSKQTVKPRSFLLSPNNKSFDFQFEHMGIPLGPSKMAHGGEYNFVLPPGWRCRELYISDPYDKSAQEVSKKKQFQFSAVWDPKCSTQLVEMGLRSGRGSFSFIVSGTASLVAADEPDATYVKADIREHSVERLSEVRLLDPQGQKDLGVELAKTADWSEWIELKPNLFGIGVNLKAMIKDAMRYFHGN